MIVKQFGETLPDKKPKKYWYETDIGKKIYCDEETIEKLWCLYVVKPDSSRTDTSEFSVFVFGTPVDVDLNELENWSR